MKKVVGVILLLIVFLWVYMKVKEGMTADQTDALKNYPYQEHTLSQASAMDPAMATVITQLLKENPTMKDTATVSDAVKVIKLKPSKKM